MNLKESYQYQNYLGGLLHTALSYLGTPMYVTKTSRKHTRSAANPEGVDETTIETIERPFGDIPVDTLIEFAILIVREREWLGAAIAQAKAAAKNDFGEHIDIDAMLSANKSSHLLISQMTKMAAIKPLVVTKNYAADYKFNAEGNQTTYRYPIEDIVEIDFDRNALREKLKTMQENANRISMASEKAMLTTEVAYYPQFDQTDGFLDALRAFQHSTNKNNDQ